MKAELQGARRLRRELGRMPDVVRAAASAALDQVADALHRRATQNAPVRSGDLSESIDRMPSKVSKWRASEGVETREEHAGAQEYGTREVERQPYLRPAIDEATRDLDAAAAAINEAVEGAMKE